VPLTEKEHVMAAARHAVQADPHGVGAVYRVSSQYFDTPDLSAYWEKVDGERVRRKYRLRYYSVEGEGGAEQAKGAFMEIKHRINNTVYKERVKLTDAGATAILANSEELKNLPEHLAEGVAEKHAGTVGSVLRAAESAGFAAIEVISYLREAWIGTVDRRFRLTFDMHCQTLLPHDFKRVGDDVGRPILPRDRMIMEVKFDDAVPRWMRDIIVDRQLTLRRFSKYAAGVEALGLVPIS
jgi:hypothetical protein